MDVRTEPAANATAAIADFVASATLAGLPDSVRREGRRAFLNILGCTLGGARHPSVDAVWAALKPCAASGSSVLIGRAASADALTAGLVNCLSSSVYTYDDAHAEAVVHPSGPVACALLALADTRTFSGADVLLAFILGVEVSCRLSKAISVAPAEGDLAWSQTGVVGGIGAAVAASRLLGLDRSRTVAAIALAVSQSSGIRTAQGSPASALMPAQGAPAGMRAAFYAMQGLAGSPDPLGGKYGFVHTFSPKPHAAHLTDGLGERFEIARLTYKPYPCGIVLGPVIDACLALKRAHAIESGSVERVALRVNPVALALTDRRNPRDGVAAQVSIYHWAAVALCDGQATLEGLSDSRLGAEAIARLRDKVDVTPDSRIATDATHATVTLAGGETVTHLVEHCVGSEARPMTDAELELKFEQQSRALPPERQKTLLECCRNLERLDDIRTVTDAAR